MELPTAQMARVCSAGQTSVKELHYTTVQFLGMKLYSVITIGGVITIAGKLCVPSERVHNDIPHCAFLKTKKIEYS